MHQANAPQVFLAGGHQELLVMFGEASLAKITGFLVAIAVCAVSAGTYFRVDVD